MFGFLDCCSRFKFLVYVLFVCACIHSPDYVLIEKCQYDVDREPWTAEIIPVDLGWRIEKCSRFSLELNKEGLFTDEPAFNISQNTPPYKTESVAFDGNCFFRYSTPYFSFLIERIWDLLLFLYPSIISRAVSLAVSGTPENHKKLRVLCLATMKQHWDALVGKNFPLSKLATKRYIAAGGRLDRQGSVPYDHYIALLGTVPVSWGSIFFF